MNKKYVNKGNYKIYSNGDIYSHFIGRNLKPDVTREGYQQVTLSLYGVAKRFKVHRLVAMEFIPNPENKKTVNHIDGDKSNNDVSNLEWATQLENNAHARENGLNPISESNSERWNCSEFRKNTSKNISKGLIESGATAGQNNGRFRYLITMNDKVIDRKELSKVLSQAQSTVDVKIRKASQGIEIKDFIERNIAVVDIKKGVQTIERVASSQ